MAAGRISDYVFHKKALLLVAAFLTSVSSQDVEPTITINPRTMRLVNINDTLSQPVSIMCTTGVNNIGKIETLKTLKLTRDTATVQQEELLELGENQNTVVRKGPVANNARRFQVPAAVAENILTSAVSFTLILQRQGADCQDAGEYTCTMVFVPKGGSNPKTSSRHDVIDVAPTEFNVTREPKDKPITVGMKLKLTCIAVIGTVTFGYKESELIWVYRNRDSANQNQYNRLEEGLVVKKGVSEAVVCSERHTVYLTLTVDENRDSLRDYFCVVKRQLAFGADVMFVGGNKNNISLPSFEVVQPKGIGIGVFIGAGLGGLGFLIGLIFGSVWCYRRTKKKSVRKQEIEQRKSQIEVRRRSIASLIVEKKQSVAEIEPSAAESSVVESSVADGSSVAPEDTSQI